MRLTSLLHGTDHMITVVIYNYSFLMPLLTYVFLQLDHILGRYGCMIVEGAGSDMAQATDSLAKWRHNIYLIAQMIQNDVSSTKVRLFLRRGLSVRYLLPTPVIDYIEQNGLYLDEGPNSSNAQYMQQLHRDRDREKPSSAPPPNSSTSSSLS